MTYRQLSSEEVRKALHVVTHGGTLAGGFFEGTDPELRRSFESAAQRHLHDSVGRAEAIAEMIRGGLVGGPVVVPLNARQHATQPRRPSDDEPRPSPERDAPSVPSRNGRDDPLGESSVEADSRYLPEILLDDRQDRDLLAESRAALFRADPSLVYHTPGGLARVEGLQLRRIQNSELHDRLANAASWSRRTKDGTKGAGVPFRLTGPLLASAGPPIPIVRAVVPVPAFVGDDLTLVTRPGRDGETLFLGKPLEVPPIPDEPTASDLQEAGKILNSFFDEFTFRDPTSRAHAVALLITLLIRPALSSRAPLFLIEASTAGTGKTTLAEVTCLAAHGELPVSTTWTQNGEEMGKRAASWALSGRSVVLLDDLGRISGDPAHVLSSLITTGAIEVRAMRELASTGGSFGGVLIATGNNVRLCEEMPRKICRIRLESPEAPWARTFKRPDVHEWTLEHRAEIVWAVGVLVAAWKASGRPRGPRSRPTFGEWSSTVGGILGVLSRDLQGAFLDPQEVADMATFSEGVDEFHALVNGWLDGPQCRGALLASEVVVIADGAGILQDVLGDGNERSRATRLGQYLARHRGKVVNGHRLVDKTDPTVKATRWSLIPVAPDPAS
ncbi:MAG: hypothetical protein U0167_00645 [bacterium]